MPLYTKTMRKGTFDILNYMSEYVTLVKLVGTLDNVNNTISISDVWIYDANYKIALNFLERIIEYYLCILRQ